MRMDLDFASSCIRFHHDDDDDDDRETTPTVEY